MEIWGKHCIAKSFTNILEQGALEQIITLLNQEFLQDAKIRLMPDVHQGKGCVIGFTAQMGDKVIPNIVGVDIGCGMLTVELGHIELDLFRLDNLIKKHIPSGKEVHEGRMQSFERLSQLYMYRELKDTKRIDRSIGTLGGGNHFIELGRDRENRKYLVIHSGSRNLGKQIADYYQRLAVDLCVGKEEFFIKKEEVIKKYKELGRKKEINGLLKALEKEYAGLEPNFPKELCYLTGEYRDQYLHDMEIAQEYAVKNREMMGEIILKNLLDKGLEDFNYFHTVHNYIDFRDNIIRKGAISAYEDEKVIIPLNMRDGSILAVGKGNEDWNYSAPHGAGRVKSRSEAREDLSLEGFQEAMKGVYTTCVSERTLDESPLAYKPMEEIIDRIGDTVDIIDIIKPIYNFKA